MAANSWGDRFVLTTFGESHGTALGCVIDGCPAKVNFDENLLLQNLKNRRPGFHMGEGLSVVSGREEPDQPEILSGIFQGKTLGTPIAVIVRNQDQKSSDYQQIQNNPRAGHADQVWKDKFGHVDHRGGGRSSGRETLARVIGGSVAQMMINQVSPETKVYGFIEQVGPLRLTPSEMENVDGEKIKQMKFRYPSAENEKALALLKAAQEAGESYGGIATLRITNPPKNLGQPVFRKLKSDFAQSFLSLGAACGIEIGGGSSDFAASASQGTEFHKVNKNYGGIQGGISTGATIEIRVHFKPTSSILDVAKKGRHDPCIVPRAIPVLEAMSWMILAEHWLWTRTDHL